MIISLNYEDLIKNYQTIDILSCSLKNKILSKSISVKFYLCLSILWQDNFLILILIYHIYKK